MNNLHAVSEVTYILNTFFLIKYKLLRMTKRKKNEVLEKQYQTQGNCCYYCKRPIPFEDITKDHVLPVSKGHTLLNNKVFACRTCNNHKGDRTLEVFKKLMIRKSCAILKKVVAANFIMTEDELRMFKYYTSVMKNLDQIRDSEGNLLLNFS